MLNHKFIYIYIYININIYIYIYRYMCILLGMSINLINIIITHENYKQITLIDYIIERVSILRAIRVSVL